MLLWIVFSRYIITGLVFFTITSLHYFLFRKFKVKIELFRIVWERLIRKRNQKLGTGYSFSCQKFGALASTLWHLQICTDLLFYCLKETMRIAAHAPWINPRKRSTRRRTFSWAHFCGNRWSVEMIFSAGASPSSIF